MLALLDRRTAAIAIGAVAAGAVALWLLSGAAGKQAGQTAGRAVGNVAAGAVIGLGETAGLPDTSNPVVVDQGRAALERGDLLEASAKLPALDFLGGIGSKVGIWFYNATHEDEFMAGGGQ